MAKRDYENYFYVDELLSKLGYTDLENMTSKDVVNALANNIKYLAPKQDEATGDNAKLYNNACKQIHMGIFKNFTLTDMYRLSVFTDLYSSKYDLGDFFTQVSKWELHCERQAVPVEIDFTKANVNGCSSFEFLCSSKVKIKDIKEFIKSSLLATDPDIFNPDKYTYIKAEFGKNVSLGNLPTMRLSKALIALQNEYPSFDYYWDKINRGLCMYEWSFNTLRLAELAFKRYFEIATENNCNIKSIVQENFQQVEGYKRQAVREIVTEHLGIELNQIVLFSVAPLNMCCPYVKANNTVLGMSKDGNLKEGDSSIRSMNYNSFFLGKIVGISDDYVNIKIKYEQMNKTNTVVIPVAWELLLPRMGKAKLNISGNSKMGFGDYYNSYNESVLMETLSDVVILLTAKNSSVVSRPLIPFIYSKF